MYAVSSTTHNISNNTNLYDRLIASTPITMELKTKIDGVLNNSFNQTSSYQKWTPEERDLLIPLAVKIEALDRMKHDYNLYKLPWRIVSVFFPERTHKSCLHEWSKIKQSYTTQINDVVQAIAKELSITPTQNLPQPERSRSRKRSRDQISDDENVITAEIAPGQEIPQEVRKRLKISHTTENTALVSNAGDNVETNLKYTQLYRSYETALIQLNAIPMPALDDYKKEAVQYKDKLQQHKEEFSLIEKECQNKITMYKTLFEHFSFYCNPKLQLMTSELGLADLYLKLLSGQIDIKEFEKSAIKLEYDFDLFLIMTALTIISPILNSYISNFSPQYSEQIKQIYDTIGCELSLLPQCNSEQQWKEAIKLIREVNTPTMSRVFIMIEMVLFLSSSAGCMPFKKIEPIILARLKNEITSQEFTSAIQQALQANQCHEKMQISGLLKEKGS